MKAIILDFDGTLVDSNGIKRGAFEKCFTDYPKYFSEIMTYCKGNNHIPRQVKFRHVFEKIIKIPYTAEIESNMLSHYATETTEQVITAPEIPGALEFLEKYFAKINLHLLSSTPHDILLRILERRGMKKYFKSVKGAPVDKAQWISQFLKQSGLKKEDILFVGDSPEDLAAARHCAVQFSLPDFKSLKEEIWQKQNS